MGIPATEALDLEFWNAHHQSPRKDATPSPSTCGSIRYPCKSIITQMI